MYEFFISSFPLLFLKKKVPFTLDTLILNVWFFKTSFCFLLYLFSPSFQFLLHSLKVVSIVFLWTLRMLEWIWITKCLGRFLRFSTAKLNIKESQPTCLNSSHFSLKYFQSLGLLLFTWPFLIQWWKSKCRYLQLLGKHNKNDMCIIWTCKDKAEWFQQFEGPLW